MPTKEVSFKSASDNADFKASLQVDENLGTKQIRNLVMSDTTAHIFLIITIWDQQFVLQSSKKMDSSNNQSSICRWVGFSVSSRPSLGQNASKNMPDEAMTTGWFAMTWTSPHSLRDGWMDGDRSPMAAMLLIFGWCFNPKMDGEHTGKKNGNKNGWFRGENRKPKTPLFWETSISCPRDPGSPYENDVMEPFECEPGSLGLGKHPPPSF